MTVAAAVLLGACAVPIAGTPTSAPGSAGKASTSSSAKPKVDPAEVRAEIKDAEIVVNTYWKRHWSEFFPGSGPYTPPMVVGLYDGRTADAPRCGGEKAPPMNALYCIPGDFVAWDVQLMTRGYEIGDSWVYLVIAHEWSHAIQARVKASQQAEARELQADCLAGAVIYGAARDGIFIFDEGDVKEIATALTEVSDETPWTNEKDHGDPFERIGAFDQGRRGGVPACLPK